MIIDKVERLAAYVPSSISKNIASFISELSADTPVGEYSIIGDSVFARVQSYALKEVCLCNVEAHDKYIDIQSVIAGAEGIDVFYRAELVAESSYDSENDVTFYKPGDFLHIEIKQKYFAVLFPHEAHRPQIVTKECKFVQKFVIKVKADLWT